MSFEGGRRKVNAVTPHRQNETFASVAADTSRDELEDWLAAHPCIDRVMILEDGRSIPNLEMVRDQRIRSLRIVGPAVRDWSALASLGPTLTSLSLAVRGGEAVDLSTLTSLATLYASYRSVVASLPRLTALTDLSLDGYDADSLEPLSILPALRRVSLSSSADLRRIGGLPPSTRLEHLSIHDARALTDVSGLPPTTGSVLLRGCPSLPSLAGLPPTTTSLDLQRCPALTDLDALTGLTDLRWLEIGDCGDLPSLRPLTTLPLVNLAVWGKTTIADGDLGAVLDIATLTKFRMDGRRFYRPRAETVEAEIAARTADGPSRTFAPGAVSPPEGVTETTDSAVHELSRDEADDLERFWGFVDQARNAAASGTSPTEADAVAVQLRSILMTQPPDVIRSTAQTLADVVSAGHSWELWGAAYLINGGCSDDGFLDFLGWLIMQGRTVFEAVTADPDALAGFTTADDEGLGCEQALYAAQRAYRDRTGQPLPNLDGPLGDPLDVAFDFEDKDSMTSRYPRLSSRVRA